MRDSAYLTGVVGGLPQLNIASMVNGVYEMQIEYLTQEEFEHFIQTRADGGAMVSPKIQAEIKANSATVVMDGVREVMGLDDECDEISDETLIRLVASAARVTDSPGIESLFAESDLVKYKGIRTILLWHYRLGHPHMRAVVETLRRGLIGGYPVKLGKRSGFSRIADALVQRDEDSVLSDSTSNDSDEHSDVDEPDQLSAAERRRIQRTQRVLDALETGGCLCCKLSKMKQLHIPTSKRVAARPGEILGTDLVGKFEIEGIGRKLYFQKWLTFIPIRNG